MFLRRFGRWLIGLQQNDETGTFDLGEPINHDQTKSATQDTRDYEYSSQAVSLAPDIIYNPKYQNWLALSGREQEITAFTCLQYTNRQIAIQMQISPRTVESYLERIMKKLGQRSKSDLRVYFAGWDFSLYDRRMPHR